MNALPIATGRETLRASWALLRRHPWQLICTVVIMLVGAVLGLVTPWALGRLVDLVAEGTAAVGHVWGLGGVVFAAALLAAVTTGVGVVLVARLFETALARLREDFLDSALALPQTRVEEAGTGDLLSRNGDDIATVSGAIPRIVPAITTAVFALVVTLAGLAVVDWRPAVAVLVTVPVYLVAMRWYLRTAPRVYAAEREAVAVRAHHVLASLRGLDTVLAYRLSDAHEQRIAAASWNVVKQSMRARTVQIMFATRLNLAEWLGLSLLVVVAFWLVGSDAMTLGAATTAVLLLMRVFAPLTEMLFVLDDAQLAAASLSRVVGVATTGRTDARSAGPVADRRREATSSGAGHTVWGTGRAAELDDVDFGYADVPVLHSVSLHLEPGEHVALVGTSGAGKTTLAALLAGIHVPDSGEIVRPGDTVLLSQETHVFAATLRENLTIARPLAGDEEVTEALRTVLALGVGGSGWVESLPDGLETRLGLGGHVLGASQEQQLALARVVLADPDLVILDEATAEADSADGDLLERAADAAMAGRTALVVAHRLTQARRCDRIVVMEAGRIVESGTHEDLVAAEGRYAGLWSAFDGGGTRG
jgi:ATP-binding cassette subfamily C protein